MEPTYDYRGLIYTAPRYNFKDKDRAIGLHVNYMLNRTQQMFKWKNLPSTIPARILELYLQVRGCCAFYVPKGRNGEIYVFTGGLGGEPNEYYMPTKFTLANPYFGISEVLSIDEDCIIMSNDSMYMGMIPLYTRYATAMTETELSLNMASKNFRTASLISASDDRTKKSAEEYIKRIEDGELSIVGENEFFEGVRVQPFASTGYNNSITNLIELEQYYKASWYNEIGLNANYNMKRESLNSAESQLNNDALLPLIDNMLECRRVGARKVNEMFGTNIKVELNSSWEDNQIEIDEQQEAIGGGEQDEVDRSVPGLGD